MRCRCIKRRCSGTSRTSCGTVSRWVLRQTFTRISACRLSSPTGGQFSPFRQMFSRTRDNFRRSPRRGSRSQRPRRFVNCRRVSSLNTYHFFCFILLMNLARYAKGGAMTNVNRNYLAVFFRGNFSLDSVTITFISSYFKAER